MAQRVAKPAEQMPIAPIREQFDELSIFTGRPGSTLIVSFGAHQLMVNAEGPARPRR